MALATPDGKRHKFRQWLSSHGSSRTSKGLPSSPAPSTSQSNGSATLTTAQQDFQNRVFRLLSQRDQDTIRQHNVTNATAVDAIVQQALAATRQKQAICQSKRWSVTFRGHTIVLREKADNIVKWLDRFKQVGDVASNADPMHVGLPWAGIRLLLEAAVCEQTQMEALLLGLETALYLSNRLEVYMTYLASLPLSQTRANFESCLVEFHALILRFLAGAILIYQKGSIARGFDAFWRVEDVSTFEDECNKMASRAETEASNCDREGLGMIQRQLEDLLTMHSNVKQLEAKLDLSKLPVAAGAAFNSYQDELDARCHPETRVGMLRDISNWADNVNGETIFWINGMAGTGKSTISRTVAQTFSDRGQLGASFFFKRGERDRENARLFFTTIAHELVRQVPALMLYIQKAVEDDPGIAGRTLKEQFDKLVFHPFTNISPIPVVSLVLVVDALDECDREGDIRTIISQLARTRELSTIRFRVFLTSRPELPIRLGFAKMSARTHRDIVLHDIPPATIEHDISIYLKDEFARIRDEHQCLLPPSQSFAPDWPGTQALSTLTQLAVPLFIVAATICRFIGDPYCDPMERLASVLDYQKIGHMSPLERTYLPVLSQILAGVEDAQEKDKRCRDFREIVGSIVLLANPLSSSSLANLLRLEKRKVNRQLRPLHSVLLVPDDNAPVHLLHLSFREFLVKENHCDLGRQFRIDERVSHRYLADTCLALLGSSDGLRKDICQLECPGVLRSEIDHAIIELCIPQHLQYACRYWVYHVQQSGRKISDKDDIDRFLRQHFLYWLECLSLLGDISKSIGLIDILQSLVMEDDGEISTFFQDARRFVPTFLSILAQAPLQVYSSAWHFSPLKSILRHTFQNQRLQNIRMTGGLPEQWNECLQTYEGHSRWVNSVVFSPDGSRVASDSGDDTVRVWDITSTMELLCHYTDTFGNEVKFSADSTRILINGESVLIPSRIPLFGTAAEFSSPDLNSCGRLGIKGEWITWASERILRLPPEYRPGSWASHNDVMVIGSGVGHVTFPPAVPEADFAVHAGVYGELLTRTSPEAERLIGWHHATTTTRVLVTWPLVRLRPGTNGLGFVTSDREPRPQDSSALPVEELEESPEIPEAPKTLLTSEQREQNDHNDASTNDPGWSFHAVADPVMTVGDRDPDIDAGGLSVHNSLQEERNRDSVGQASPQTVYQTENIVNADDLDTALLSIVEMSKQAAGPTVLLAPSLRILGEHGLAIVNMAQFTTTNITEERFCPSGAEYKCKLAPLSLPADFVESMQMGRVHIQGYKHALIRTSRLGTLRHRKRKLSHV